MKKNLKSLQGFLVIGYLVLYVTSPFINESWWYLTIIGLGVLLMIWFIVMISDLNDIIEKQDQLFNEQEDYRNLIDKLEEKIKDQENKEES